MCLAAFCKQNIRFLKNEKWRLFCHYIEAQTSLKRNYHIKSPLITFVKVKRKTQLESWYVDSTKQLWKYETLESHIWKKSLYFDFWWKNSFMHKLVIWSLYFWCYELESCNYCLKCWVIWLLLPQTPHICFLYNCWVFIPCRKEEIYSLEVGKSVFLP